MYLQEKMCIYLFLQNHCNRNQCNPRFLQTLPPVLSPYQSMDFQLKLEEGSMDCEYSNHDTHVPLETSQSAMVPNWTCSFIYRWQGGKVWAEAKIWLWRAGLQFPVVFIICSVRATRVCWGRISHIPDSGDPQADRQPHPWQEEDPHYPPTPPAGCPQQQRAQQASRWSHHHPRRNPVQHQGCAAA